MKILVSFLLLLFVAGCVTTEPESSRNGNPPLDQPTGTALSNALLNGKAAGAYPFPEEVLSFEYLRSVNYEAESPGYGFSTSYRDVTLGTVAFYFYDMGHQSVPDGTESELIKEEVERLADSFNKNYLGDTIQLETFHAGDFEFLGVRKLDYNDVVGSVDLAMVRGLRDAILSIRITLYIYSNADYSELLQSILDEVSETVIIPNIEAASDLSQETDANSENM